MKTLLIASIIAVLAQSVMAEIMPSPGGADPRVRTVTYNENNVVRLNTYFGVSTHVQFGDSEQIKDVAVGDDLAWKVIPRGNNLFIKPVAKEGDTNITIITNRRTYHFVAVVVPDKKETSQAWASQNLTYSLSFRYPDDDAAARRARELADAAKAAKNDVKTRLAAAPAKLGHNMDYWVAGSEEIAPTGAYDDGRFIYLTFNSNRDMPAVYEADKTGKESLINTNVISGNTIVVQRLVPGLVLRKGEFAASVINKSYDRDSGRDNLTGTVAPDVVRTVKESQ